MTHLGRRKTKYMHLDVQMNIYFAFQSYSSLQSDDPIFRVSQSLAICCSGSHSGPARATWWWRGSSAHPRWRTWLRSWTKTCPRWGSPRWGVSGSKGRWRAVCSCAGAPVPGRGGLILIYARLWPYGLVLLFWVFWICIVSLPILKVWSNPSLPSRIDFLLHLLD